MILSDKIRKSKEKIKMSQKMNVTSDLLNLTNDLKKKHNDKAFLSTIPVTIVSSNESFFKDVFSSLVDFDQKYMENSKALIRRNNVKIEIDDIYHITKSTFSLGDVIAYSLKYSSIESLIKTFEELSGIEIFRDMKTLEQWIADFVFDPLVNKKRPLNKDRIFKNLKEAYDLRNVICHDFLAARNNMTLDPVKLTEYLLDAALLQEIVETICSEKIYTARYPSDDNERIKRFTIELKKKEEELEVLYSELSSSFLSKSQMKNFKKNVSTFNEYVANDAKYLTSWFDDLEKEMPIFKSLQLQHSIKLIDQRIKNIREEINNNT